MGALPRPEVPPGPHRELVDALHDLHHRAGWPSLRRLAEQTGVSHTTVSKALSSAAAPQLGDGRAVGRGDGRRRAAGARAVAGCLGAVGRSRDRARRHPDRGSRRRAEGRTTPPDVGHRAAAGHGRGRHRQVGPRGCCRGLDGRLRRRRPLPAPLPRDAPHAGGRCPPGGARARRGSVDGGRARDLPPLRRHVSGAVAARAGGRLGSPGDRRPLGPREALRVGGQHAARAGRRASPRGAPRGLSLGRPEHPRPAHPRHQRSVASTVRRDMALGRPGRVGRAHGLAQPRSLDGRGHCRRPATAHPGRDGRAVAPAHGHRGVPRPRPADPPPQSGPAAVHGAARREPGRRRAAPRPRRPPRPAHRGPRRRLVASGAGAGGRSTSDAARHAPGRDGTAAGRDGRGVPPTGGASPPPTGHG